MILETIVTTTNEDGSLNVSPMGPTVPVAPSSAQQTIETFQLRPFDTSRTFANLKRTQAGVLHITDDVDLFARSAIGKLEKTPQTRPAENIDGQIMVESCRAYEFKVEFIDETGPRMSLNCRAVQMHRHRDFLGFNRAKHAILEAAILATRLDFLPSTEIADQFHRLKTIVEKTGGQQETSAFELLETYVNHESQSRA